MPGLEPLTVVICVDHASVTGGQAKVAIESAIGLKKSGARPILFAAVGPPDPRLAEAGVEVVCLGQHDLLGNPSRAAAAWRGLWNSQAASALKALLARLPRERTLVHVHGWAKALSPSIVAPLRAAGVPAIYTIHEYFLFCPNGGFYNYQRGAVCALRPLSLRCLATHCDSRIYAHKLWRFGRLYATRRWLRMAEAFSDYVCISDHQRQIVGSQLPAGARLHRLSDPIDAEDLGPKAEPASGDLIFVGRLSPEKGVALFAEAAARVGVVPTLIGDGPQSDELKRRFPEARFLGWLPPEEARARMRAARALIFPSLWYETQGLTAFEAQAMGTPVIVSDVCAAREAVEDGVSGLWFKSASVEALAAVLTKIRDDALVARLSRAAYETYWRAPATLEAHVAGLRSIYAEALGRKRADGAPAVSRA
jgi:glycosyltransferase involved in cell wall biosynthesis